MYPFTFPPMVGGFFSLHTFCRIYCYRFFEMLILIDVISHWTTDFLSLRTSDFRIFSSTLWPSLSLLWNKLHLDLWPIFFIGLLFDTEFYKLFVCVEINSLWLCLHEFFFSILGCLFFFPLMVSFVVQMLLMSIRCHLFIFVFYVLILRGGSKKISLHFMSKCVLLFFLKSSIVSVLLFRHLSYLQFIFVNGVSE